MQETLIFVGIGIAVVVVLLALVLMAYSKLFQRAEADEALVRTGKGGPVVVTQGGLWVIGLVHNLCRVPLDPIPIPLSQHEGDTLQLVLAQQELVQATIRGTLYLRVGIDDQDILQAAKSLEGFSPSEVLHSVAPRLGAAIRHEALGKTEGELHDWSFASDVDDRLNAELRVLGLRVEKIAIEEILIERKALTPYRGEAPPIRRVQ